MKRTSSGHLSKLLSCSDKQKQRVSETQGVGAAPDEEDELSGGQVDLISLAETLSTAE